MSHWMSGRKARWLSFAVYLAFLGGAFLAIDALMGSDRQSARWLVLGLMFMTIPFTPSSGFPWRWPRWPASRTPFEKLVLVVGGIATAVGALLYHVTHHALIAAAGWLLCLVIGTMADEWTHRREYAAHHRERREWERQRREELIRSRVKRRLRR